jgi:hypothetical protein
MRAGTPRPFTLTRSAREWRPATRRKVWSWLIPVSHASSLLMLEEVVEASSVWWQCFSTICQQSRKCTAHSRAKPLVRQTLWHADMGAWLDSSVVKFTFPILGKRIEYLLAVISYQLVKRRALPGRDKATQILVPREQGPRTGFGPYTVAY